MKRHHRISLFILLFLFLLGTSADATRQIEWRDDGLYVVDKTEFYFEPLAGAVGDVWSPRVASLSPDEELIAYVKHTGGGYEDEGQSCFIANRDGTGEFLLYSSDFAMPQLYWLETPQGFYVAMQLVSGGTLYRSYFVVVDLESGEVAASVEGLIYGTLTYGTRYQPEHPGAVVGLKYEVIGQNEFPAQRGIFSVDELIRFAVSDMIESVDGMDPEMHALTDGDVGSAYEFSEKEITITLKPGSEVSGLVIQSGWQFHLRTPGSQPWEGTCLWDIYARPRFISITYPDGTEEGFLIEDSQGLQWLSFGMGPVSEYVILEIVSVYFGTDTDQLYISEIYPF